VNPDFINNDAMNSDPHQRARLLISSVWPRSLKSRAIVACRTSGVLPILSRVRRPHGPDHSLAARALHYRRRTSGVHDPIARAPARTVLDDLHLLCSGNFLQRHYRGRTVARVCLDGPAGPLARATLGGWPSRDLSNARGSGGNSPLGTGNVSGR
jgi:hypothetical protein